MEGRRERQLTQSNPSSPYTYFFLHSTSSSSVRQQQCEEKLAGIVPTNFVRVPKLNLSLSLPQLPSCAVVVTIYYHGLTYSILFMFSLLQSAKEEMKVGLDVKFLGQLMDRCAELLNFVS